MYKTSIHNVIALTTEMNVISSYVDATDVAVGVGADAAYEAVGIGTVTPSAGSDICFCVKGTIEGVQVGGVLVVVWL